MPCVIIISNGSTAELNIVSELSLAPCMALFLTTKHSLQLRKGAEGLGVSPVSLALRATRADVLSRFFFSNVLKSDLRGVVRNRKNAPGCGSEWGQSYI